MLAARMRGIFVRRREDAEFWDEIREHVDLLTEENVRRGMPVQQARREAKIRLGAVAQLRETHRELTGLPFLETLFQDVRYALRTLRKAPGFAAIAVLTLALAIGANTAIFSLIDAVMLRSLPVRNPQQLLLLEWSAKHQPSRSSSYNWSGCPGVSSDPNAPLKGCTFSYPMFGQLHARQDIFSDICAFVATQQKHLTANGSVSMANGFLVSGDFFATLGVRAILGRTLGPADDKPGSPPVVVLSYTFWKSHFGGAPSIIGKSILVEKTPFTVVGVLAPGFAGLDPGLPDDLWMPLSLQDSVTNSTWLEMMARLKPGVSVSQAQSALSIMFAASTTSGSSAMFKPNDSPRLELTSAAHGLTSLRREFSQPLFFLMTSVGIILLIACANVGGLSLARASSRRQEIAIRFTLGATRARIMRQLLTESLLTSAAGAALGVLLAYWSARALADFLSANWYYFPIDLDVRPDRMVLTFTIAVAVLAAILFGLAPARQGARVDLASALKGASSSKSSSLPARRFAFGSLLVVAQVALSIVVLAGAGLLMHTLVNLEQMNVGFETDHLLLFSVDMTMAGYSGVNDDPHIFQLDRNLQTEFSAIPGVTSASYSGGPLLSGGNMSADFKLLAAPPSSAFHGDQLPVGPGFFETMRIPLLSGRSFTVADLKSSTEPQPAVVNQSFARRLFGSEDPLGRGVSVGASTTAQWQIVGVVRDAKYDSLRDASPPTIYTLQRNAGAEFELRTKANPMALVPLVRETVNHVNNRLLLSDFKTQEEQIDQLLYQERLVAGLSSLFGALALLLACIGLYGLLSYEVAGRTREIGIRMALGAQRGLVLRFFVRKGVALTTLGAATGLAIAAGATRFLQTLLYAVKPTDPVTFVAVTVLLVAVALAACYIPARRAMKVDPMVALRYE
jgi:predicted permease